MTRVGVAAWDTPGFSKKSDLSIYELACQPCLNIFEKKNINPSDIDSVIVSSCSDKQYLSNIISEMIGVKPKIANRLDSLCNSGTNAIVSAYSYIQSGLCESALVIGMEKNPSPGAHLKWDITRGAFSFPVHWAAMYAKAHMRKYGTTEDQLARVSVNNRKSAANNETALFRKQVSLQEVRDSRIIADPLRLLECSLVCEGSSALLLASEYKIKQFTDNPVWIKGIGQQNSYASFGNLSQDLCSLESSKMAANGAYKMAQMTSLDIDIAELHDAFSIMEIIAYEDLGFAAKGSGGKFAEHHEKVINSRGGLIGCGHPIGATGIAQVVEVAMQLAGEAKNRQVVSCRNGLIQNIAAGGSSATVLIVGE